MLGCTDVELTCVGQLHAPCVSGRIDHLIQIKDSPSARGREDLLGQCKIAPAGY